MGISCSQCYQAKAKKKKLNNLKILLSEEIVKKEKEISNIQETLEKREEQIKKTAKAIKAFPHNDESKKNQKIEELKDYKYDQERDYLKLKYLIEYNQILKNNLNNIEIKMMKLNNKEHLQIINEINDDVGEVDTKEDLEKNIDLLLKEKKISKEEMELLDSGNKVLNSEINAKIENYINNLLST